MQEIDNARSLISSGKYKEAGKILDNVLAKNKEDDDVWYLRGIVSLKLRSYEYAHECFEHALWIAKRAKYYKIVGMAHIELFEINAAIENFERALRLDKKDPELYFFIAVCFLLTGDPGTEHYLKTAWKLNKRRTKELLKNFYDTLIRPDYATNQRVKEEIEKELERLK